jgi:hypothetical protein
VTTVQSVNAPVHGFVRCRRRACYSDRGVRAAAIVLVHGAAVRPFLALHGKEVITVIITIYRRLCLHEKPVFVVLKA